MRFALPLVIAALALGCKSDPIARVKRNVADREEIQAEGLKLRQQNLCTVEAIAVAKDPDRHYLACLGFGTADGPDPGLLAFREGHEGAGDRALFAACHDSAAKVTHAVGIVLCNPALERLRAAAWRERETYLREGRCKNQALRTAQDPDFDYFACYGHQLYFEPHIRLADFKKRFGPDLGTIRQRCPQLRSEIQAAEKKRHLKWGRSDPSEALAAPDEVLSFANAYGVFCTEEPPRGAL